MRLDPSFDTASFGKTTEPRVLNVNPDAETLDDDRRMIAAGGASMLPCLGPERRAGCPMLNGSDCPLLEMADAVVLQLDLENAGHRELLRRYAAVARVPFMVAASAEELHDWPRLFKDVILSKGLAKDVVVNVGPPSPPTLRALIGPHDAGV